MIAVAIKFLLRVLATNTAKKIAIAAAKEMARRTDNTVDDVAVAIILEALTDKE